MLWTILILLTSAVALARLKRPPVWERYALPAPDDEDWRVESYRVLHKCGLLFSDGAWGDLRIADGAVLSHVGSQRERVKYERAIVLHVAQRKYSTYLVNTTRKLLEEENA